MRPPLMRWAVGLPGPQTARGLRSRRRRGSLCCRSTRLHPPCCPPRRPGHGRPRHTPYHTRSPIPCTLRRTVPLPSVHARHLPSSVQFNTGKVPCAPSKCSVTAGACPMRPHPRRGWLIGLPAPYVDAKPGGRLERGRGLPRAGLDGQFVRGAVRRGNGGQLHVFGRGAQPGAVLARAVGSRSTHTT